VASELFPFPVGDDPNDPDVLEYWMSVARRFDGLLLPRDLKGWREFIAERVSEYRVAAVAVAVEADRMRDDDTALIAARRRRSAAHSEFVGSSRSWRGTSSRRSTGMTRRSSLCLRGARVGTTEWDARRLRSASGPVALAVRPTWGASMRISSQGARFVALRVAFACGEGRTADRPEKR
jgi:hypothetical protein